MKTPLGKAMAHLLVRQHLALVDEGIWPKDHPLDIDQETLKEAVRIVRSEFSDHALWDSYLLTDEEHLPCSHCPYRKEREVL